MSPSWSIRCTCCLPLVSSPQVIGCSCKGVRSVAVADVPHTPVIITRQRQATFTDCLPLCCLSEHVCLDGFHGREDDRIGATFVDDETISDLVTVLHVLGELVVCVHAFIIGDDGAKSRQGGTDVDPSQRRSIRQHRPEPI